MTTIRAPRYLAAVAALALICSVVDAVGRAEKQPPAKPLDLNTATVEQLEQLPGIGPVTAKAIVRFRTKTGPFRRVEDLLAIRGITKRKLEKLRPYVSVAPPAPAKKSS
jgi:competence ComEA-like helix-hairpin-helix protein